jgi:CBS domain-containing protein
MKVRELMVRDVKTCRAEDDLDRAARIMWEADCGIVPVIDASGLVRGMITDRDVCMAAYTKGRALRQIRVGEVMASRVHAASPEDTLETAMSILRTGRVRRLPVVDADGKLMGILSMNDLARLARREMEETGSGRRQTIAVELAGTLGTISERADSGSAPPKRAVESSPTFAGVRT